MHILTVQTVSDFFFRILTVQTVSDFFFRILTVQTVSDFFFRILTVQTVSDVIPGGFGFRSQSKPPLTNPKRMTSAKTWS